MSRKPLETAADRDAGNAVQPSQALTGPRRIDCDDAPVSSIETMAEVRARLARRIDPAYAARAAFEALSERQRVELIGELLSSFRGARAKDHLARTRNLITCQLHRLITSEYDAEVAARPGLMAAEIARPEGPAPASSPSLARRSSAEDRADLGAAVAATPRPEARVSPGRRMVRAARALDDSWIGDALGAVCLFAGGYLLFVVAGVLS
ncbi:hypothetical protein [Paracoccus sanguinis]|uniref:Uncharacterized protein n=1 Tax=Paracoccus sanguinis TaxID=1545044 RepID=A0A099GKA9_9RHOB|nr:hypothetical protein [Paracoccus sanguinis]KGJ23254.1 hypothetical protein IX56_03045 [Paracoccus sanguinis]